MDRSPSRYSSSCAPTLRVDVGSTPADRQQYLVHARFRIGRAPDCEVRIDDQRISRYHADGVFYQGEWWIRDLKSSNGIFVAGRRVDAIPVKDEVTVQLGFDGPSVDFRLESAATASVAVASEPPEASEGRRIAHVVKHYFGEQEDRHQPIGARTMMIRQAFRGLPQQQRRKYAIIFGVLALLMVGFGLFAFYQLY